MDVSKNFCDGKHKLFIGMKEQCQWKAQTFYWNEGAVSGVLCKSIFEADLLGSQHLFEILQTPLTVKNSENVVKSGCFEKYLRWRAPIFFLHEGGM